MIETKKIIIVSHATTLENEANIHQGGSIQGTISEKGKLELELLSESLRYETIDYVLCSPLRRCIETYNEIAKYHPALEVEITEELRSKMSGVYEGKPRDLVNEELEREKIPIYEFKPERGESTIELQTRTFNFINTRIPQIPFKNILVVTHGGVITVLGLYLYSLRFEEYNRIKISKASITRIQYDGEFKIISWNNTNHLKKTI